MGGDVYFIAIFFQVAPTEQPVKIKTTSEKMGKRWGMLKQPGLNSSVLLISVFQERPNRGQKISSKIILNND